MSEDPAVALLTSDGRIPKNKWLLIHSRSRRLISRHRSRKIATDQALIKSSVNGETYSVGEIRVDGNGNPFVFGVATASRTGFFEV